MQTFGSLLASLVAVSSLVAAAPGAAPAPGKGAGFSVPAVINPKARVSGAEALAKIHAKYNKPMPDYLTAAVRRQQGLARGRGSVKNVPVTFDNFYLAPVEIGTPPQKLLLNFDTGSSDLWVFSNDTNPEQVLGQTLYYANRSSTAKLIPGQNWTVLYADFSLSAGIVYSDVVSIGGVRVPNQAVESAQTVSFQFSSQNVSSGLVGLGFDSLNQVEPTKQKTWFENAIPLLELPLFTVNFFHKAAGTFNFGYIDPSEHLGPIHYSPVNKTAGTWSWKSTGYSIGTGAFREEPFDNIADTGTSLLMAPPKVAYRYWSKVPGSELDLLQGGYVFPCTARLPDFSFGVGDNATITIPGSYMNYIDVNETTCFGALQSSAFVGVNIWGDIALKAALVVFDSGKSQIGWAPKRL
ncbi:hypothetical protein E4U53_007209 [Claviceps sorghi]|nr:hypothetical protein E4U53_007209 [Claviceps sorghi]